MVDYTVEIFCAVVMDVKSIQISLEFVASLFELTKPMSGSRQEKT